MRVLPKLLLLCTWLALGCEAREASFDPDEFEGMGNGVIGAAAGGRAAASDAASAIRPVALTKQHCQGCT